MFCKTKKEEGLLALFTSPADLIAAIRTLKKERFTKLETFTPFPIHGLEKELGIKRSWIPYVTFVMAMTGMCLGMLFQYYTMDVMGRDWHYVIGGKAYFSWQAFIPVTFESAILIGGVCTVLTLFIACGLPNRHHEPLDERLTDDLFGLFIEKEDPKFSSIEIENLLKQCDVKEIKQI